MQRAKLHGDAGEELDQAASAGRPLTLEAAETLAEIRDWPRTVLARAQSDAEAFDNAPLRQEATRNKWALKGLELRHKLKAAELAEPLACKLLVGLLVEYSASVQQLSCGLAESQCATLLSAGQDAVRLHSLSTLQGVLTALQAAAAAQEQRAERCQTQMQAQATAYANTALAAAAMRNSGPRPSTRVPEPPRSRARSGGECFQWSGKVGSCKRGARCPWHDSHVPGQPTQAFLDRQTGALNIGAAGTGS
jgi:hypothetical protein